MIRMCVLFLCMFVAFPCFGQYSQYDAQCARDTADETEMMCHSNWMSYLTSRTSIETAYGQLTEKRAAAISRLMTNYNLTYYQATQELISADWYKVQAGSSLASAESEFDNAWTEQSFGAVKEDQADEHYATEQWDQACTKYLETNTNYVDAYGYYVEANNWLSGAAYNTVIAGNMYDETGY